MKTPTVSYKRHRFPPEIIGHAVWLYFRFALSFRDVEEFLAVRGVVVTYETIRPWCGKFGQAYADGVRRKRPQPGEKWHLDEVCLQVNGRQQYLWRAVDQHGVVLDILVQSRRNTEAATRFFKKLLSTCQYAPRVVITDKLQSDAAALAIVLPRVDQRQHKGLNNRAENAHQPTRQRERQMRRFKSAGHAHQFLSAFGPIRGFFCLGRHRLKAADDRAQRRQRFASWQAIIQLGMTA